MLFSFLKLLLGLAELGKVQGSNLLSLLNLLLVSLDLLLELARHIRHSVLVLLVFILSELKLLNLAFSSLGSLHVLRSANLDRSQFRLELTNSVLKLSHGSLATSHGSSFSISKSSLKISKGSLEGALGSSLAVGMILFSSKFISKTSSINHGLLGLLLRVLGSHSRVRDFHIKLALGSFSRVKESTALLNFSGQSSSLTLSNSSLLINLLALARLIFISLDGFSQLILVTLDCLQALSICLVGMIQTNFKLIDISFKFLLDAKSLSFSPLFSLKRSSQGFHCTLVVLASIIELFFLLSNSSINFLANLAKFKLSSKDLVFLLLKSTLSLFKSSLKLFLPLLKPSALFVQVMDGASTISKLVKEILDFIGKILVFPLDNVKLFNSLILGSSQTEKL